MGWIMQDYEGEVHIVPDTETGHVLSRGCFCAPREDELARSILLHRDKLARICEEVT